MERVEKERKSLYLLGWILFAVAALYLMLSGITGIRVEKIMLPCIFHSFTGYYCPGCGGTRAAQLLLEGRVLLSVYYHPLVLYGAILYLWFMVSNTIEYMTKGRIKVGMRYKKWYVMIGVVILTLNFLIKNGAMLLWHYSMIP